MESNNIISKLKWYWLDYNSLRKNLGISFIRWSWKWWQKRNKTSSTCQVIDIFDYSKYIPVENTEKYKGIIVIKTDIWRSQEKNLEKALENWESKILSFFTTNKERTKDEILEKERKTKIKEVLKEVSWKKKYKNRFLFDN